MYRCNQPGHISQGCRNQRVVSGSKRDELSKSTKKEAGKEKRDNPSSEARVSERHNKSVRQTRFQEVTDNRYGSSDDSSEKSGNKTRTKSIAIEVNALITQEEHEDKGTQRVPLMDLKIQEIALKLKVNGKLIKAIMDTESPVTVISRGVYNAMEREFEKGENSVSIYIRKSNLKLFSCKKDQAVATSGECDVKLKHDDFKCITPVILAKGLAHECMIGMNMFVRWLAMKEERRVLLKRQPEDESDNSSLSQNPEIARLNNICLPRIRADFDFKNKILSKRPL